MQLSIAQDEIKGVVDSLLGGDMAAMFDQSITINNVVIITHKVPVVGDVMLQIAIKALNGSVELNITKANIAGMSIFGTVRKKAGDLILSTLKPYSKYVTAVKSQQGNILLTVKGINFTQANIAGEDVSLAFEIA